MNLKYNMRRRQKGGHGAVPMRGVPMNHIAAELQVVDIDIPATTSHHVNRQQQLENQKRRSSDGQGQPGIWQVFGGF